MVCSKCKIPGHNIRTCFSFRKINSKKIIILKIKKELQNIKNINPRKPKVYKMIELFEFLHTNSWFVHTNTIFNITAIVKMNALIKEGFPSDIGNRYLTKYIKLDNKFKAKECPICFESFENKQSIDTVCGHSFCVECLWKQIQIKSACPICRYGFRENKDI